MVEVPLPKRLETSFLSQFMTHIQVRIGQAASEISVLSTTLITPHILSTSHSSATEI